MDEKLSNLIDSVKYMKINETGKDDERLENDDLRKVLVIANRKVYQYAEYRLVSRLYLNKFKLLRISLFSFLMSFSL